jgi:Predicted phosphoesterase or phosphohydrolase
MAIWFTSDNHWFHQKLSNIRGFADSGQMNDALREKWNKTVKPGDTVYNLGDVSFASLPTTVEFLSTLNGTQHLVFGNHDKQLRKKAASLLEAKVFASMQNCLTLKLNGLEFYLHHFAHRTWNKSHYDVIHLFGHSHGHLPPLGKSVDVGFDDNCITSELRPIALEEVLEFMKDRKNHDGY